ncbi:MAG: hypothetical protein AB1815_07540 [Bacillota bacterium]
MDSANIQRGLNPPLNEVSFKGGGLPMSLIQRASEPKNQQGDRQLFRKAKIVACPLKLDARLGQFKP